MTVTGQHNRCVTRCSRSSWLIGLGPRRGGFSGYARTQIEEIRRGPDGSPWSPLTIGRIKIIPMLIRASVPPASTFWQHQSGAWNTTSTTTSVAFGLSQNFICVLPRCAPRQQTSSDSPISTGFLTGGRRWRGSVAAVLVCWQRPTTGQLAGITLRRSPSRVRTQLCGSPRIELFDPCCPRGRGFERNTTLTNWVIIWIAILIRMRKGVLPIDSSQMRQAVSSGAG